MEPVAVSTANVDTVNGCCINPEFYFMATCSGQCHLPIALLEEERKDEESPLFSKEDNCGSSNYLYSYSFIELFHAVYIFFKLHVNNNTLPQVLNR